jgi:hypothetical protein
MKKLLNMFGLIIQKAPSTQLIKPSQSEVLLEKVTNEPLILNRELNDNNNLIKMKSMKNPEMIQQWVGGALN